MKEAKELMSLSKIHEHLRYVLVNGSRDEVMTGSGIDVLNYLNQKYTNLKNSNNKNLLIAILEVDNVLEKNSIKIYEC